MSEDTLNKDSNEQIRQSLDSLIEDDDLGAIIDATENLPAINAIPVNNYADMKSSAESKAKTTITSLLKFYLSEDIIEQEDYVKANMKLQELSLSKLIYLMETGEKAITTLLNRIDSGEFSPRMFEVLGTLQKSLLDVIKSQTMYLMAAEESTKKIARDIDIYEKGSGTAKTVTTGETDNVRRGTKSLMSEIQNDLKEERIEDIEAEENLDDIND